MADQMTLPPVAIVGIGSLFPQAESTACFWSNVRHGIDAISPVPESHWRHADYFHPDPKQPDHTYGTQGGFLEAIDFDPLEFGIAPQTLEAIDTTQLLGLVVAKAALRDAGLLDRPFHRERCSVILGVTGTLPLVIPLGARLGHPLWAKALSEAGVPAKQAKEVIERIAAGYVPWQEDSFPGLLGNVVAGRIANRLDLRGTNCVVDAACASSLSAIHLALLELASGRSDLVVSGGFDTFNDIFMYMCFSKTPALSPSGQARPFAADGDGTTLGEGLGCVVLKRLDEARRDGDRVYAVIRGLGSSSDGKGQAIYAPSAEGQARALRAAYQQAGVSPASVELVEAHGTGTKAGDLTELNGLLAVYREAGAAPRSVALGSVKSQIGHTKAAAGAAGLIRAALALHHKTLPPTLKAPQPLAPLLETDCPFYLPALPRPWLRSAEPRRAAVSSFGFGGSNFHVVLEEAEATKAEVDWDGRVELLPFAAKDLMELMQKVEAATAEHWVDLQRLGKRERERFDPSAPFRLVFVLEKGSQTWDRLRGRAMGMLRDQPGESAWQLPEGVYFSRGPQAGPLAFLFPGQGSQRVGALREFFLQFPEAFRVLEQAHALGGTDSSLTTLLFPPATYSPEESAAQGELLTQTQNAQPALGVLALAALEVLRGFGLAPKAVAGHSFGEWPALAAAGRVDIETCLRISFLRGQNLAEAAARQPGGMVAVAAPARSVQILLAETPELREANRNSPNQTVVAGPLAALERFRFAAQQRGWQCRPLSVAAAFHTPAMQTACAAFSATLETIAVRPSSVPVVSNTTGQPFPPSAAEVRALLARQLVEPIDFVATVKELHHLGCRTFVEVGPGTVLTRLTQEILAGAPGVHALALDASKGHRTAIFDLARLLAQLAALGHAVELRRWQETYPVPPAMPANRHTVKLSGANYVRPRPEQPASSSPAPSISTPPAPRQPLISQASPVTAKYNPKMNPAPHSQPNPTAWQVLSQVTQTQAEVHRQLLALQAQTLELMKGLLSGQIANPLPAPPMPQTPLLEIPVSSNGHASTEPHLGRVESPPLDLHSRLQSVQPNGEWRGKSHPKPVPRAEPAPEENSLAELLCQIVAEKTGYPRETLNLDLELDADLGIDSIKRVEIFSALQEARPGLAAIEPESVGKLRTLRAIVQHLSGHATPAVESASAEFKITKLLQAIVAEKTGYPPEMLEPHLQLDADLGIDSIKRVEIFAALQERLPNAPLIEPEQVGKLRTLADVAAYLDRPGSPRVAEPHRDATQSSGGGEVSASAFF